MAPANDWSVSSFLPSMDELQGRAETLASSYRDADPFPHAVIDGLLDIQGLRDVADELPPKSKGTWRTYDTATELKHVFDRPELFGPAARRLSRELNATEFVRFLERLTGIHGLIPDPHLKSAGYFDVPTGGFLRPHVDFTTNDDLGLIRRVNALVYLNEDWSASWGGQLELWRSLDDGPVVEIVPELGRLVVFDTTNAPHGHPKAVGAPGARSRLCFSAYYFSSPLAADAPNVNSDVTWAKPSKAVRVARVANLFVPPIIASSAKTGRRAVRSRKAQRQARQTTG